MKKIIAYCLLFLLFLIIAVKTASASDLFIDCSTSCTATGLSPLFSSSIDGLWYPGRSEKKIVNFKNSSANSHVIAVSGKRSGQSDALEKQMNLIIENMNSATIWSGRLSDFYNEDKINLGSLASGESKDFKFGITLIGAVDNSYQSQTISFDAQFGFWEEEVSNNTSPTVTPTSNPAPTTTPGLGPTAFPTSNIVTSSTFAGSVIGEALVGPLGSVLGVEVTPTATFAGEVKGVESGKNNLFLSCLSYPWILPIIFFYLVIMLGIHFWGRGKDVNYAVFGYVIISLVVMLVILKFLCFWWFIFIPLAIGIIGILTSPNN